VFMVAGTSTWRLEQAGEGKLSGASNPRRLVLNMGDERLLTFVLLYC
jgi:hypothetical protein